MMKQIKKVIIYKNNKGIKQLNFNNYISNGHYYIY